MVKCVSWRQKNYGSCFLVQSASLCHFIGRLMSLILRVIIEKCLFIPFILLTLWFCLDFFGWAVPSLCIYLLNFLECVYSSPDWNIPSSVFYRTNLVVINFFNLFLSWKDFNCFLILVDSFVEHNGLGWQL